MAGFELLSKITHMDVEDLLDERPNSSNDSYYSDYDDPTSYPIVRVAAKVTVFIYIAAFTVGIPANIYVFVRMRQLARTDGERYRNGTGIALCSMAAADLCSLLLICLQNVLHMTFNYEDSEFANTYLMHILCKFMLFMTHTVTGISIWSWLLLSLLRYLAICHPLYHLRLWRMPYRALGFITTMCLLLNSWLLVAVQSSTDGCTQVPLLKDSLLANQLFHLIECTWSFCVPCVVIVVVDSSVLLKSATCPCLQRRKSKQRRKRSAMEQIVKLTRSSSVRLKQRHQRALWKWLLIALVCILLNAPENIYRLVVLFGLLDDQEDPLHYAARVLAQALYFSQFAFNALYLAVFVYDKTSRARHNVENSMVMHSVLRPTRSRVYSATESSEGVRSGRNSPFLAPAPHLFLHATSSFDSLST